MTPSPARPALPALDLDAIRARLDARYGDVYVYERDGVRWYRPRMGEYEQKVREAAGDELARCFNDDVGTKVKIDEEAHGETSH